MKLISACLLGIKCAWDGMDKYRNEKDTETSKGETLIPIRRKVAHYLSHFNAPAQNLCWPLSIAQLWTVAMLL